MAREGVRPRRTRPAESNQPASRLPEVQVEPAPIVHVTIGRVEVRATAPAPEPQRQRSQPPLMPLDEYLRRRSQGSRK